MKNCKVTILIVVVLGALATFAVWERMQILITGYKASAAEKEISQLRETVRQNEINIDYLRSKQMLISKAMSDKIDIVQPVNVQIVRKDDNIRTSLILSQTSGSPNDRRRQ